MAKVIVQYGQTWLDIAMQEMGDVQRVIEIVQLNGRSLTDELQAGEELEVPVFEPSKRKLVALFSDPANKPASGSNVIGGDTIEGEGIEFWGIENDFLVS